MNYAKKRPNRDERMKRKYCNAVGILSRVREPTLENENRLEV